MIAPRRWTPRRWTTALLGGLLLLAATLPAPSTATAAPPALTVSGTAKPDATITFTITVAGGPVGNATLSLTSPASAPPRAATITVDGAAAPAATVTQTGTLTVVRLGTGAGAATGGQLADGTHTVTYRAAARDVHSGDAASATATGTAGALPVSGSSGPVAIPTADLALAVDPDLGGDGPLQLGTGQSGAFAAEFANHGTAVSDATLTIELPAHLRLDPDLGVALLGVDTDDEDDLDCFTNGPTVRCDIGQVAAHADSELVVGLIPSQDAPVGSQESFTVTATPTSGTEATPADNAVTGTVRYAGASHLSVTLDAAHPQVPIGSTTAVQVTVRNLGPQAAPEAITLLGVLDRLSADGLGSKHFTITHFSGALADLADIGGATGGDGSIGAGTAVLRPAARSRSALLRAAVERARRHADAASGTVPLFWNVGMLAPGRSATETLTVKATTPGTGNAVAVAFAPNDPTGATCLLDAQTFPTHAQCPVVDSVTLTAVHPTHGPSDNGAHPVADTGAPDGQLAVLGLLAVVAGALLMRVTTSTGRGRRR